MQRLDRARDTAIADSIEGAGPRAVSNNHHALFLHVGPGDLLVEFQGKHFHSCCAALSDIEKVES
jgi:hypothetical protein